LMVEALPNAAIVSIAHRSTVAAFHQRRLRYVPAGSAADGSGGGPQDGQGDRGGVSYRVVQDT